MAYTVAIACLTVALLTDLFIVVSFRDPTVGRWASAAAAVAAAGLLVVVVTAVLQGAG